MRLGLTRLFMGAVLLGTAPFAHAVTLGYTETWAGSSVEGWTYFEHSGIEPAPNFFGVTNGSLSVHPMPNPDGIRDQRWSFVADATASSGAYVGDLYDHGAHMLEFDLVTSVDCVFLVQLVDNSSFGAIYNWETNLTAGAVHLSVPIDLDHFFPDLFGDDSVFESILRNTDAIWLTTEWDKDAPSPEFAIDNVVLRGVGPGYGAWIDAFTLDLSDRFAHLDADGDGILNGQEYQMDSSPETFNGPFIIHSVSNGVIWTGSSNCMYTVLSSTNLIGNVFEPAHVMNGTNDTMRYEYPGSNSNMFYKVQVERK